MLGTDGLFNDAAKHSAPGRQAAAQHNASSRAGQTARGCCRNKCAPDGARLAWLDAGMGRQAGVPRNCVHRLWGTRRDITSWHEVL